MASSQLCLHSTMLLRCATSAILAQLFADQGFHPDRRVCGCCSWYDQLQKWFAVLDAGQGPPHAAAAQMPGPLDNNELVENDFEQAGLEAPRTHYQFKLSGELAEVKCASTLCFRC